MSPGLQDEIKQTKPFRTLRQEAQLNIENLLDEEYFVFANSNTNITPGSPLAARVSFTVSF